MKYENNLLYAFNKKIIIKDKRNTWKIQLENGI